MKKIFIQIQVFFILCLIIPATASHVAADTVRYAYDDAGRLIEADFGDKEITYTYDKAGNLLDRNVTDSPVNYDPVPDVRVNGSNGPVTIPQGDNLTVTITLNPGSNSGENADWWVVINTPFPPPNDWYHYDLISGWMPGLNYTFQSSLFNLTPPFEVLNVTGLPVGAYTFYFGVDMGQIHYDGVAVNITP